MSWPRWIYALEARLRAIAGRRRADAEIDEELSFHLEMQIEENRRRGMNEREAARRARLELGGVEQTKEASRDVRPLHAIETLVQDIRYAFRQLRRAPVFATVAILTLALGVGGNAVIFALVNGVLLRPLPWSEPDELVRLYLQNPEQGVTDGPFSVPELDDWRARTRSLESIAGYTVLPVILTGDGDPVELQSATLVGDVFGILGTPARIGRTLEPADDRNALANAVISERLWSSRFGRNPTVLGRQLVLSARTYTIVGVMPAHFRFPTADVDVWTPQSVLPDTAMGPRVRTQRILETFARLAPSITVAQAEAEARSVAARLASEFPDSNRGWSDARVVPLRTTIVGEVDRALVLVLAVAGVILLIACANLANLLLARGTARAYEMATRAALGAERRRIVGQLMTESLVIALLGAMVGLALSIAGVKGVIALSAGTLPRLDEIRLIDARVVAFALGLALLTAILFGILPAFRAAGGGLQQRLRGARGVVGAGRLRPALVVAEVALAVVLVIAAGLMARSLGELRRVDPGFDPERTLAVTLQLNMASAGEDLATHLVQRRAEILERIGALPGVRAAGSITALPLDEPCRDMLVFVHPDGRGAPDGTPFEAPSCFASPGYLETMRIPLLRGEPLPAELLDDAPLPFLVTEEAAERFWPGEDPVGRTVRANYGPAVVVGIVGDVRQQGLDEEPPPAVYFNQATAPRILTTIVVRTDGDPLALAGPIRDTIAAIDPNQPVRRMATLEEVRAQSMARDRFFTLVFAVFGALALVLAAVGIYGVLAYSVSQRTAEIGVRMALGARVGDILRQIVGEGMLLVTVGAFLGAIIALAVTRLLATQLHGVSATDPAAFILAPATLLAVALLACWIPARRATRIEAMRALRNE